MTKPRYSMMAFTGDCGVVYYDGDRLLDEDEVVYGWNNQTSRGQPMTGPATAVIATLGILALIGLAMWAQR